MNNYFRRTLTVSRVYLVDNIDYENLRDFLIEHEILPIAVTENIDSLPNRRQKVREMLDSLVRRADIVFPTFLVSLFRSNQHHIASKLYETAINFIEPTDFLLKEWLENNIKTILLNLPENNSNVTSNANPPILQGANNEPVENSLPLSQRGEKSKPMEAEESGTFEASSLSDHNQSTFVSFATGKTDLSLKSQIECSTPSSSLQLLYNNNSFYQMDSSPRGLFCIIIPQRSRLTDDSFPVQNLCEKEGSTFTPKNMEKCTLNSSSQLQKLFMDLDFSSCLMEVEDSTFHPDKLNSVVLQFSQLTHDKFDCCAMALLGFSANDLNFTEILSYFKEQNCPSLAGKPKLFLFQIPNGNLNPSNLMSGVEIPEDALVAVGAEETDLQPGLVSSVVQVCQQMEKSSNSVQEIFNQVQFIYPGLKMAVEKSLTKLWIVDSKHKLQNKNQ